jgi:hypothetical protein
MTMGVASSVWPKRRFADAAKISQKASTPPNFGFPYKSFLPKFGSVGCMPELPIAISMLPNLSIFH